MELAPDIFSRALSDAREGKQAAYSLLLNTFWAQVYNFQLKRTQDEYAAEEVTIQTFSRAFDNLDKYDADYSFGTWLTTISKNLHIDLMRKERTLLNKQHKNKEQKLERVPDENPTPEDALITKQNLSELLRHIKMLKPHYQIMINLRYFQEQSYKEMAENLDEPVNNVKVKLLRARRLLADLINSNP